MNEIIKKQLQAVKIAQIPHFDDDTIELVIPRYSHDVAKNILDTKQVHLGRMYIIKFANYIIKEPTGFTLHANWNNNNPPKDQYMKILVIKDLGKMVKVSGTGYDIHNDCELTTQWEGWCPKKSITIIKELIA